jgi:hypothetical protein
VEVVEIEEATFWKSNSKLGVFISGNRRNLVDKHKFIETYYFAIDVPLLLLHLSNFEIYSTGLFFKPGPFEVGGISRPKFARIYTDEPDPPPQQLVSVSSLTMLTITV